MSARPMRAPTIAHAIGPIDASSRSGGMAIPTSRKTMAVSR